jgi:8-oxo-dGTP pyrophosphatase MutT (NUDIX family)
MYKGAGVMLFRQGNAGYEVFLGQRSINQDYGKWSIPGGGYEEKVDRNPKENAFREFWEETHIDLKKKKISDVKEMHIAIPFFFDWHTFLYTTEDKLTEAIPCEFSRLQWIPLSNLHTYELCFGVKEEVQAFLKAIKNA